MTTRIRYEVYEDPRGKYDQVSVRNFHSQSTDAMYIIYLDTENVSYVIKNMLSGRKYDGGNEVSNLHVLKRHVKARLEKLGVVFGSEIRDNASRVKGVNCGYSKSKSVSAEGE